MLECDTSQLYDSTHYAIYDSTHYAIYDSTHYANETDQQGC